MSILQRYIFKELLAPLGLGLAVFTFLFLIGQLFRLMQLLFSSGVSAAMGGELILSLLPGIVSMTLPMSILLAVLLSIGRLAADREILAIRSSGVNLARVCMPLIIFAALISGAMIWANQRFVPFMNLKTADLATQIAFQAISAIPPGQPQTLDAGSNGPTSTFLYEDRDPDHPAHMRGVRIYTQIETETSREQLRQDDQINDEMRDLQGMTDTSATTRLKELYCRKQEIWQQMKLNEAIVVANEGRMAPKIEDRMIAVTLTSGTINVGRTEEPGSHDIIRFDRLDRNIVPRLGHETVTDFRRRPREMSSSEIRSTLKTSQTLNNKERSGLITEYFQRLSIPLACIAFALIGIPLAVFTRPTGKAVAFGISLLLILVYYGLMQYGLSLGRSGSAVATVWMFLPNILLSVLGIGLMYRMVMR